LVIEGGRHGVQKVGERDRLRGLRLVEASLRLGEDHAEGYERGEDNESRDGEEQQNIKEEIHSLPARRAYRPEDGAVLWVEPFVSWLPARRAYDLERAYRARFTVMMRNIWDAKCRQTCPVKCEAYFTGMAFNLFRGSKLIVET
jgi:hypothetical protein